MRHQAKLALLPFLISLAHAANVCASEPETTQEKEITIPESREMILNFLHTSSTAKKGDPWIAHSEKIIKSREMTAVQLTDGTRYLWGPWQVHPAEQLARLTSNLGQLNIWFRRTDHGFEVTKATVTRFVGHPRGMK